MYNIVVMIITTLKSGICPNRIKHDRAVVVVVLAIVVVVLAIVVVVLAIVVAILTGLIMQSTRTPLTECNGTVNPDGE